MMIPLRPDFLKVSVQIMVNSQYSIIGPSVSGHITGALNMKHIDLWRDNVNH